MSKKSTKKTSFEEQLEKKVQQGSKTASDEPSAADQPSEDAQAAETAGNSEPVAEAVSGEVGSADVADDDITALEAERDALQDQLLRARAEFDNYRKRTAREIERIRKTAAESLVRDLLPVVDHLELALQHADEASRAVTEGVEMVARQFTEVLSRHGVEPIPALGEPFDPNVHEAMMQRPDAEAAPNIVLEEFQRGYRMGEVVLRPSKVVVSSGPQDSGVENAADSE